MVCGALPEGAARKQAFSRRAGYPEGVGRSAELACTPRELTMTGLGNGTRKYPRSRGRMRSGTGPDRATLGIIGLICAIAGFFTLGLLLGPVALICGWLSMGRRWTGSAHSPPDRPDPGRDRHTGGDHVDVLLRAEWGAGGCPTGRGSGGGCLSGRGRMSNWAPTARPLPEWSVGGCSPGWRSGGGCLSGARMDVHPR